MSFRIASFALAASLGGILLLPTSASAAPAALVEASPDVSLVQPVGRWWRRDRDKVRVRAPLTSVDDSPRGTAVDAPFASVRTNRFGTWVRAPFVNLWAPRD